MMDEQWTLRPAVPADAEWLADLKATVMRADLERLGVWDRQWARRRFLETFVPANTAIIEIEGRAYGSIAVRPEPEAQWIEHFYLDPALQGRGIGGQVLRHTLDKHRDARPFHLAIDRGSKVRPLYERHGFTYHHTTPDGYDEIFTTTKPDSTGPRGSR
jgi:GNAT superfamily N-acetyltransferase